MVDLGEIRKEYTQGRLDETRVADNPFTQFHAWFEQYQETRPEEPTVMTLASVDADGQPWQRILLLKSYDDKGFVFFTNYQSNKGMQLDASGKASMHFFWIGMERQVQIQGRVEKVSREESAAYFHSRPRQSQLGAWASHQSRPLENRAELEARFNQLNEEYQDKEIPLPDFWGGFRLIPERVEFWQGGEYRLHDRVEYRLADGEWAIQRLNP
ncbi:pyridoxamine 5'-phosphate oxidase [Oceanobacter kriegii]|uniref:pyridoxamine 5'-phosphate oxidase n=1 Tax=Oceanobacter kriegii TaxID=64972 RepID=UPI000400EC78|nr:pyridoxamine 5'-phosphate oxidase [Oceanobacter kriegii]